MSTSTFLSYTGAVTGIAGAVMGFVSYRRSGAMKTLDLRIELRKAESIVRAEIQNLPGLLGKAKRSRTNVLAATGGIGSGAFQGWTAGWNEDFAIIELLKNRLPMSPDNYRSLNAVALEDQLVSIHALRHETNLLGEKYLSFLGDDDKSREHIRADQRIIPAARRPDNRA
jgi:hypothetical protein